ncbi:MAG: nuclease [Nitrospira bacterium HGW-Nitrospira-1]|nr:MAG: nuclease [Nitrospira bacterium HGW-Nitrospira-1]
MPKRHLKTIFVLLFFFVFLSYGYSPCAEKDTEHTVRVKKIYDGDTIGAVVAGRFEKIRLIGIDAPETGQRLWGKKAKKCIGSLMANAALRISLEYDMELRDKYGRILAYIWTQDGHMINEEMLKKGCAVLFTFPPNVKYVERFRAAQKKAQEHKAGIWGENGLRERPYDYRKKHPRR